MVTPGDGKQVGAARKRVEDPRLLRGEGAYVDDLREPGMLHAVFVRSPHPHARILGEGCGHRSNSARIRGKNGGGNRRC